MDKATTLGAIDRLCDVLRPGDVLGEGNFRYRVTEYVGEGGCGAVYAAEDVRSGKPVAIKIYASELSCDALLVNKRAPLSENSIHAPCRSVILSGRMRTADTML